MQPLDHARIARLIAPYRVPRGDAFRLQDHDPGDTGAFATDAGDADDDKAEARQWLAESVAWLAEQQAVLYAQDRWSLLVVIQALDAAGKDGTIRHVASGLNPQGCEVSAFRQPSAEELDHDYLWRASRRLPPRGHIGIFNRSYYEEVLVAKVHPEVLAAQKLPPSLVTGDLWERRYRDIANFESYLAGNGTVVLKFFLNVSRDEQKRRLLSRLDEPGKHWKFQAADVAERRRWDEYRAAYEAAIRATAADHAPWYVVPADHKWYTRLVVAGAIVQAIAALDLRYPEVGEAQRASLAVARAELLRD